MPRVQYSMKDLTCAFMNYNLKTKCAQKQQIVGEKHAVKSSSAM